MDVNGLRVGMSHRMELTVTAEVTPPHLLPTVVLSTPKMVEYMEVCSLRAVEEALGQHRTSVGTVVNVTHDAAAREGELVEFTSRVAAIDRRRVTFEVAAHVGDRLIGQGIHERFVVERDRFGSR